MRTPRVTVLVIAYNHAPYIRQALSGVFMQKTSFEFEVLISEDASDDGTREIVTAMADSEPDRIRLLLSDRNLRDNSVIRRGFEAAAGQYVALLDGDDYWTSDQKLQKQIDLLDTAPDCSSCFHNVRVAYEDQAIEPHLFHQEETITGITASKPKPRSTLSDIVRGNFVPTCSAVFRSTAMRQIPRCFDQMRSGDWALHVLGAQRGDLAYIDEVMATYRVHSGGWWTANRRHGQSLGHLEEAEETLSIFNRYLGFEFDPQIGEATAKHYEGAAVRFRKRRQNREAVVCARRALGRTPTLQLPRRWRSLAVLTLSSLARLNPRRAANP